MIGRQPQPAGGNGAADASRPLLAAEGVTKRFASGDVIALNNVSLGIRDNELFTLLGPSGCGKTTLLRIFAGFEHPTSGGVFLDGRNIANEPPHKRPVNTMFQSYALFPHLSIGENISFGLEMLKWEPAAIKARVAEMLRLVHLTDYDHRRPSELSGGQQQRVALARALAPKPRVLLLDEPLSALDLKLRRAMQGELKKLQRETAVTFVIVTHDQEEALALSDRIAVMNKGEVLQLGEPREIYENPNSVFVADFIGEANLIPGALIGLNSAVTVSVRPEKLEVAGRPIEGRRNLPGAIASLTYLGSDTLVEGRLSSGAGVRCKIRGAVSGVNVGDAASFHWSETDERKLTR